MNIMQKIFILTLLLNLLAQPVEAQRDVSSTPLDTTIRHGRLTNGFEYFIKSVPTAESKVFLRLYNKAGSNQSDPDQLDPAHAVEHLGFKSSKNFPSGIRQSGLLHKNNMGMYDIGASSGSRMTKYYFDAPSNNPDALNFGLLWFKDISQNLHLTRPDVEDVKGELRQEILFRNGDNLLDLYTNSRLNALMFPCSEDEFNFLARNEDVEPESLRRFYKDWYRPDLMAVSVVGNIDNIDRIVERIQKTFAKIPTPENARAMTRCDSTFYARPSQFLVVERPGDSSKVLQDESVELKLFFRDSLTAKSLHTMEGIKRLTMMKFLDAVIKKRLGEVTEGYGSSYMSSNYAYFLRELPPGLEVVVLVENDPKESLGKAINTLKQLHTFGVSSNEWEKLKERELQSISSIEIDAPEYWINEIEEFYAYGEALPPNKHILIKNWLKDLDQAEFNSFIKKFLSEEPDDIGIIAPAGHKILSATEEKVRSWIQESREEQPAPYESPEVPISLMTAEKIAGLPEKGYTDMGTGPSGAREIILNNGVKVVLKNFKSAPGIEPKITLHGFSSQGANSFSKEKYFSALNSSAIVQNSGVSGLDKFELKRFLAETSLPTGVRAYVGDSETGIKAQGKMQDLEIMLQLILLYFTQPNRNEAAFEDWKDKAYEAFRDPSYNLVDMDFKNAVRKFLGESPEQSLYGIKSSGGTYAFESVKKTDYDAAYAIYKKLFGNPEEFTFLVSGDFEIQEVLPLLQKYLGNLPKGTNSPGSPVEMNNDEITKGPLFTELPDPKYYRMKEVMYGINYIKEAESGEDWKERLKVQALAWVTTKKAWDLRFEKGYSLYDVGVWGQFDNHMNRYEISSVFSSVPAEWAGIREDFEKIVEEIKSGAITSEEFQEGMRRMYYLYDADRAPRPGELQEKLYNHYRYGQPWLDPLEAEEFVNSITIEDVIETGKKYFKKENRYEFLMKDNKSGSLGEVPE